MQRRSKGVMLFIFLKRKCNTRGKTVYTLGCSPLDKLAGIMFTNRSLVRQLVE